MSATLARASAPPRPVTRAPQDPPHLHLAARALAELVADGTIGYGQAAAAVGQAANRVTRTDADLDALSARLEATILRAVDEIESDAAKRIRAACRWAIDRNLPPVVILVDAELANAKLGRPFSRAEVERIAADEAARRVSRQPGRRT